MSGEVEWRRLRADELRARAAADAIVVLPLGAIEQHGPHLPVEVDSTLGEAVALRTAHVLAATGGPVVVLPMMWAGVSEHHMSFGGTITLDLATYAALVGGIVRSVERHGFSRIVLLNAHGGNENPLRAIVDDLAPRLGVKLVQFTYWHAAAEAIARLLERQTVLLHACEAETSMMMALRPDLVATDRILPAGHQDATDLADAGVYRWRTIAARSATGVIGHPEAASAEKGERLLEAIATALAAKLIAPELWAPP